MSSSESSTRAAGFGAPMIFAVLCVLAAVGMGVLWRMAESRAAASAARVTELEQRLAASRGETKAEGTTAGVPKAEEPEAGETKRGASSGAALKGTEAEKLQQAQKTIAYLESRLGEARRELTAAKQEAAQADARIQSEGANVAKAMAEVRDLREELEVARRNAASTEQELRSRTDALTKAEAAYKQANERVAKMAAEAASSTRQITANSREIDDLSRRRENYMTSLQRRFREVTDLYRGFALDQQSRGANVAGGTNSANPPTMQAGDLSRIQNAITQAEDDLRQVQTLNARIATLMKPGTSAGK
ncbi:hypothetical protein F183_A49170 [Bryobacterales bacterium F-183]|nr:hypothetical protein F183_A49170 [Bryobacterales bacterium F-183]